MTWRDFWRWLCCRVPLDDAPLWIFFGGSFWCCVVAVLVAVVVFIYRLLAGGVIE
jgi:hypothetical protein